MIVVVSEQEPRQSNAAPEPVTGMPYPPYGAVPPYPPPWYPPAPSGPDAGRRRRRRLIVAAIAAGAVVAVAAGSVAVAVGRSDGNSPAQASADVPGQGGGPSGNGRSGWGDPYGSTANSSVGSATAAQQAGVVDINTVLDFGRARAAGTGLVLTSAGEVLTNNHVIDGSTSISVTVVSTGRTYTATVVGTDATDDIAVLQLRNATGLATAAIGNSSSVRVGDTVTAVGNAGGTGGVPSAATGTVTALDQPVTATDTDGSNPETLAGMIEVNAAIQAGDSGGPLYASNGTVIGIDTAGSTTPTGATTAGFAIPISTATSIADRIEAGRASSTIRLGYPAFLGVQLDSTGQDGSSAGAAIAGVVTGSAAAGAGLQAGDRITAVGGTAITSSSDLSTALAGYQPGQRTRITWVDSAGTSHSATVTLGTGPAD